MLKRQNNNSGKKFEREVFSLLKEMCIIPKGYYTYHEFSDIIGYQQPQWPYTIPSKVLVEILMGKITIDKVLSFAAAAKDSQTTKALLFGKENYEKLSNDIVSAIKSHGLEYIGPKDIKKLLKDRPLSKQKIQTYVKANEVVAAQRLVDSLPEFSQQKIPHGIQVALEAACPGVKMPAWNIFEESVCAAFRFCLGYRVRQLGKEVLFENEPEGVVSIPNENRTGFIYECKSAKKAYKMSANDKRVYIDYIRKKKGEVNAIDKADMRYFVLVGPKFLGDKENRRDEIYHETGVLLIYLKASTLKLLAQWAFHIDDPEIKRRIDIGEIFKVRSVEVDDTIVMSYMKNFDKKYKNRY